MKKLKIVFWIIPIGFLVLVGYQNKDFFQESRKMSVDLMFAAYETPELQTWMFFAVLFLFGILLMFLFSLPGKFKAGKSIKNLTATNTALQSELAALTNEVSAMRNPVTAEPAEKTSPPASVDSAEPR